MAEDAIADGITHVVGTPHSSMTYKFDFAKVRAARDEVSERLGDRLTLATGCDFHMDPENLKAIRKNSAPFCINQKDYLLVEFNEFSIPPSMDPNVTRSASAGTAANRDSPGAKWDSPYTTGPLAGMGSQGNVCASNSGIACRRLWTNCKESAWEWITEGLVHFVSSDAHNTTRRPLKLKFAYDAVKEQCGEEKAHALFSENPLAAFEGHPLPYIPEISTETKIEKRKRFFFF